MGRTKALAVGAVALTALFSSLAQGEVSQKQGVRVTVNGGLSPTKLPREGQAPVAVSVKGAIAATKQGTLTS